MVEGHVDGLEILNKLYDTLSEKATILNGGVLEKVQFSSATNLVERLRKEHEEEEDYYDELLGRSPENRKPFKPEEVGVYSIIADDSDGHRTRRGYFKYSNGFFLPVKDQRWLITGGEPKGQYPADAYIGDIAAVEMLNTLDETIQQLSEPYFTNSIIILQSYILDRPGRFAIHEHSRFARFNEEIEEMIKTGVHETERECRYPTYNPTIAGKMVELFMSILERTQTTETAKMG